MIIKLRTSQLFTTDPAIRFAKEYGVSPDLWREMWRRYKDLEYTVKDLCDYFELKTKRRPGRKSIIRWLRRAMIYWMANEAIKKGAHAVVSEYFEEYEQDVIQEATKHIRAGTAKTSVVIL